VVNAALDPVLIWGGFGVPGMGVAGAAWATGIAALLSACVGLAVLAKDGIVPRLPSVDRATIADIVKIGAPISMTGIAFSGVYVVLGRLIVRFGETNMGALGLGHRLESFVYLASTGFAVAAATLVGQNLGAKDAEGARRSVEITARNCTVFMVVGGLVAFVFADTLVASFTPDPVVRAAAAVYLRVQATIWVGMGFEMVYEGAFAGAGYTTPPMWIIGVLTAARVPLAWALAVGLDMGVVGVWVAVALSTLIKGLLLRAWWARGTWATRAGLPAPTG
jgi:putative MATE family efflux protein